MTIEKKSLIIERRYLVESLVFLYGCKSSIPLQFYRLCAQLELTERNNRFLRLTAQYYNDLKTLNEREYIYAEPTDNIEDTLEVYEDEVLFTVD